MTPAGEARDPYWVLGVLPSAPLREVRDAYRRRARMAHPDLAGDDSAAWMRDLNAAWEILKDPGRRAAYDAANGRGTSSEATDRARFEGFGGEPWRGAAGPPPSAPFGTVLESGIYAGWSLSQVARRDRGYLTWLQDRPEGRRHAAEIGAILGASETESSGTSDLRPGRRRG